MLLDIPPLPQEITEAQFQQAVINIAQYSGWLVTHFRPALTKSGRWATAIQGHKGFPDLVLAKGWNVIIAELKTNKGKLSPEQVKWATEIGPIYRLWRPQDWKEIYIELSTEEKGYF